MRNDLLGRARAMRREPTPPEARLWQALRARQAEGWKFRRQVPVGPFIVDFFCPAARLVIEVDGATHVTPDFDRERDTWLQGQGLTVLRFWNNEVMGNLDGVLSVITAAIGAGA